MPALKNKIKTLIAANGPMPVNQFMTLCLTDPDHGYYVTRDPLGSDGDFITAPEISQMFGEVIGAWCAHIWIEMGRPGEFALIEPGPGRGTLMRDILRTTAQLPGFNEAAQVVLVEAGTALVKIQKERLADTAANITWQTSLASLPELPTILIANEFIDALPIRQLEKTGDGWRERGVGISDAGELAWGYSGKTDLESLVPPALRTMDAGTIVEIAPERNGVAAMLCRHLLNYSGAALFIDYGYDGVMPGDSFQAVKGHEYADPLEEPGAADLTAHVDFSALAKAAVAEGAQTWGPIPQGTFLEQLGIRPRAEQLIEANVDASERITAALARLTGNDQMGMLFKALAITSPGMAAPPPFPPKQ